jgi:hypothetical protein
MDEEMIDEEMIIDWTTNFGLDFVLPNGVKIGDTVVLGKPLRDWTVQDIIDQGILVTDWSEALFKAVPVGGHVWQIMGLEFEREFTKRRHYELKVRKRKEAVERFKAYFEPLNLSENDAYQVCSIFENPFWGEGWHNQAYNHTYCAIMQSKDEAPVFLIDTKDGVKMVDREVFKKLYDRCHEAYIVAIALKGYFKED